MKPAYAVALLAAVLVLGLQPASACCGVQPIALSYNSGSGWIQLHRPDGETVHVNIEHIVFVMSAINSGADRRARAKLQLVNGFCDVRESVDEVMQLITSNKVFVG
jgi:hypothetical protein